MTTQPMTPRAVWAMTGVLALLSIFPPLATDMYLSAMSDIAVALDTSHSSIELSLSLFFLGLGVGQFIIGPLLDGYGRKRPLMFGIALFCVTSAALLMTRDATVFIGLRFLQAVGACTGMLVGRAMVNDLWSGREAAKRLTVLVMLMTLGPIIAPSAGAVLLAAFGWQSIFVVMLGVGVLAFVLAQIILPETLPQEARVQQPMRRALPMMKSLLVRPEFTFPALTAALVQSSMFAFITGSAGVFKTGFGVSNLQYGLLFALIAGALALSGPLNARLLDRFDTREIVNVALPVFAGFAALLVAASTLDILWLYVVPLWGTMAFVGLLTANLMAITMGAAKHAGGVGSALLGAMQFGIAFLSSSAVALGQSGDPMNMARGILVPALIALALWHFVGRRRVAFA
ncbi:multidrug effflux MFS transporter [Sagittula sp. SSi028]|uniref:multidrug effflux MFS transporter n=1 Tax=Sagittula sp. SSi028 TaxID=3400636 RepID=UPI003AF58FD6